jgi:hypothetical protein
MQRFIGLHHTLPCRMTAEHLLCVAKRHAPRFAYYLDSIKNADTLDLQIRNDIVKRYTGLQLLLTYFFEVCRSTSLLPYVFREVDGDINDFTWMR